MWPLLQNVMEIRKDQTTEVFTIYKTDDLVYTVIWRRFYICMTETRGFTAATKAKISYAKVSSVVKPDKVRHLDVAVASGSMDVDLHSEEEVMEVDESSDEESSDNDEYLPDNERKAPQTFTQAENDLVRDLGLPKDGAEYLAVALKKTYCQQKQ